MKLKPRKIRLLRELSDDGVVCPVGTPGLQLGSMSHFDLEYVRERGGRARFGYLPSYHGLVAGEDYEDQGEWDGTTEGFIGWHLNPLRMFMGD